jgi:hypothetical protein
VTPWLMIVGEMSAGLVRRRCVLYLREASPRGHAGRSPVQVWAGGAMPAKLQVKPLVRTLSVPVRGVSRPVCHCRMDI